MRVKLIDAGRIRTAVISNIGHLDKCHVAFPAQSINLCLLKIAPWNHNGWDEYEGTYVERFLQGRNRLEKYGNSIFELMVQFQIKNELIFAFDNIAIASNCPDQYATRNYDDFIIEKGLAYNTTAGIDEMFQHANAVNVLSEDQLEWFHRYVL